MHRGLVVHLGSVPINGGSGLGAEVAVPSVEIECADAGFAADTLELYPQSDPIGGVVSHDLIVVLCSGRKDAPRWAVEGNLRSPSTPRLLTAGRTQALLWPLNPTTRALGGRSDPFNFRRFRCFLIGSGFSIMNAEPSFQLGHQSSKILLLSI